MNRIVRTTATLTVGLLLVTACGDDGSTKAGGAARPVTLRIGTEDDAGRPGALQIQEFAGLVDERSDGRITIEPIYNANEPEAADWDQVVARKVVSGKLDMGMIPARAWDTEGVDSLRALQAPMLIDSEALLDEVVTSAVADDMLAGLDDIGITGLALVPESLRRIFGFTGPVVNPDDFRGKIVRAPTSATTSAIIAALGGTADDFGGHDARFQAGIEAGEVAGAESSFVLAHTLPAKEPTNGVFTPPTGVANQVLFPKVNSLVVNAAVFDALPDEDQEILREAAGETVRWAVEQNTDEEDAAASFCGEGGIVVNATDEQIDAAESALATVYDWLEEDTVTAAAIDEIRDMKKGVPAPTSIEECGAPIELEPGVAGNDADLAAFPDGVYRVEITDDDLRAFLPAIDGNDLRINRGIWTWTLLDGTWKFEQRATGYADAQEGDFRVEGDKISFHLPASDDMTATFTWRSDGDTLEFVEAVGPVHPIIDAVFRAHPWQKIGNADA